MCRMVAGATRGPVVVVVVGAKPDTRRPGG